jgi:RHS repeat-associated protein
MRAWLGTNSMTLILCVTSFGSWAATYKGTEAHRASLQAKPSELHFSAAPKDSEFLYTGLFAEPLAPVASTRPQENRELAQTVLDYRDAVRASGASDAVEPLLAFIDAHPKSPWVPTLQLNVGIIYRQTGHFSKALSIWDQGWQGAQSLSDREGQALANALVARLSQLEAYLGRKELLQPLLESIQTRPIGGTAAQLITDSREGLYDMVYRPEESFRCGPLALTRILKYGNNQPSPLALKVLQQSPSTDHGLSLSAVKEIAERAGMHYQAAFRSPGAPIIVPAVAHWKVGHYAAVVDRDNHDRYIVQDTTFGEDIRISASTLDQESSGYFLVPEGTLPAGWRTVGVEEGDSIWGRGDTGTSHDTGATGSQQTNNDCDTDEGCTTSAVEPSVVGLQLRDTPVGYHPPLGPDVRFSLVYSHRDTQQPSTFAYINFGPKWTFTWLSYVTDNVGSAASATLYQRGGGSEPFSFPSGSATTAFSAPYSQTTLTRTVNGLGASTSFTLTHPDGSFETYGQASGNQFFMTAIGDKAGNTVTIAYDATMRITAITDAIGQLTTLTYGVAGSPLLVTQITDPFGRSASFTYNASGLLSSITDVLGITSSYTYGQGSDPDFINTLTTPYGSTSFTYGDINTNPALGSTRFVKTTDPLGRTSYVEFDGGFDPPDSIGGQTSPNLVPTGMNTCNNFLQWRNTFVFDANQYALATAAGGLDYHFAKILHWLHMNGIGPSSRVKESEKEPLENRVWYNYPGQFPGGCDNSIVFPVDGSGNVSSGANNQPSAIGRVLDDGTSQVQSFQYNGSGNLIQSTDPIGRQMTYSYASNGIDLLTTSNTTSGTLQLLETRSYNGQHLPLTVTGANGKTDHYQYNAAGQVTHHTDALGHTTTMTYNALGQMKSAIGPIATATYHFAYDAVSRISAITDPAESIVHYTYDAADRPLKTTYPDGTTSHFAYTLLDLTKSIDRMGQVTHYKYDADRELISTTDPLGNVTHQGYSLSGKLNSLKDQNGHTTAWLLDAQSRPTAKQFANGTSTATTYENTTSRVVNVIDAVSQTTDYTYNIDNSTATISYGARQATPSVSFTYDPAYSRVLTMMDGTGRTTYTYNPVTAAPSLGANLLKSVTSPVAGTAISDTVTYSYDALDRVAGMTVNGAAQSTGYDALGRVIAASNPLDTFSYGYSDGTSRIAAIGSTLGPSAAMTYFSPTGDELLQQISYTNHAGTTSLAQFGYTYNANDNVSSLAVTAPSAQSTTYSYDANQRLKSGLIGTGTPQYEYEYDPASNLTSITANGAAQGFSYNAVNEIVGSSDDANGSTTSLAGNAYKWDGTNRVVHFANTATGVGSSFTYDGLGRLVRIVDTHAGAIIADHSYTWCGNTRCLAHDNTQTNSPVSTQYFDQGALVSGTSYYYIRDQLGSVTSLASTTGSIVAQYAYDPYGNRSTLSGTVVSDVGYAGYFYHAASGLEFTLYRAYDPAHARWLNRDPIAEEGGLNLYAYVGGNPISRTDPLGLMCTAGLGCYTTPAERALAQSGNYLGYYQLACAGGDATACFDEHIAANDNFWGRRATNRLLDKLHKKAEAAHQCLDDEGILNQIRSDLAKDYASSLPQTPDQANWPSASDIAQYHWNEFGQFGLPPDTFGGTPFGQNGPLFLPGIWCPNCRP